MTDSAQTQTDEQIQTDQQAQPPAPWLHTAEAVPPPTWAAEGPHPGPSWPSPAGDAASSGSDGASRYASAASTLQAFSLERPEVIIGAAFAGGLLLAVFLKYLAR